MTIESFDPRLLERRPTRDILGDVLQLEAAKAALEAVTADLRGELDRRARQTLAADGVAPTWRAPGLGRAQLSDPQPKPTVINETEFAEWAAQNHPSETTAHLSVPADVLPAVVEVLQDAELWDSLPAPVLQTSGAWRRTFLDSCQPLEGPEPGDDPQLVSPDGLLVPGTSMVAAAPPRLSVVLEPAAKADAVAKAAQIGMRLLERGLAGLTDPVEVASLEHAGSETLATVIDLDADGEPDYDERASEDFYAEDPPLSEVATAVANEAAVQAESRAMLDGRASVDPALASLADVDLSALKVDALRNLAGNLTLSTAGRKADLIARIAAHRESLLAVTQEPSA